MDAFDMGGVCAADVPMFRSPTNWSICYLKEPSCLQQMLGQPDRAEGTCTYCVSVSFRHAAATQPTRDATTFLSRNALQGQPLGLWLGSLYRAGEIEGQRASGQEEGTHKLNRGHHTASPESHGRHKVRSNNQNLRSQWTTQAVPRS
jgi:hypothetical protein